MHQDPASPLGHNGRQLTGMSCFAITTSSPHQRCAQPLNHTLTPYFDAPAAGGSAAWTVRGSRTPSGAVLGQSKTEPATGRTWRQHTDTHRHSQSLSDTQTLTDTHRHSQTLSDTQTDTLRRLSNTVRSNSGQFDAFLVQLASEQFDAFLVPDSHRDPIYSRCCTWMPNRGNTVLPPC